jgi:hypothetical protein
MKHLLLFTFFLVLSAAAFAQRDSVSFTPHWKKGDILKYKVYKTRSDYNGTRLVNKDSSSYDATIIIKNTGNGFYDFEWKDDNNIISGKPLSPLYKPVMDKYKNLTIKYRTNGKGVFQHITNLDEQTSLANDITKIMAEEEIQKRPGMPPALIEKIREEKSPEQVEQLLSKEMKLIHWAMNRTIPLQDTVRYKTEMPDFFTKLPAKASGEIHIDSVVVPGNIYIKNTVTAEADEAKKMLSEVLSTMLPPVQNPSPAEKEMRLRQLSAISANMRFGLKDETRFIYSYRGWPVKIASSTKATITTPQGVQVKEERTEIVRVE